MKILFFTGKGGVGKSTLAAAAAWQLSRKHRVLAVSLDPAHNLGDVFGVSPGNGTLRFSETLHLREVDLKKLARDYLDKETRVLSESYHYLRTLNLDRYFSILKYSPGIEEYALLTSIEKTLREEAAFDYIVFDTPPTGLTLRFLALPQVTIAWIERLTAIRRQILDKRHTIQKIRGPLKEGEANPEVRLDYDEKDDDILKRLRSLDGNYRALSRTLQGKDCGVVVVFNPDLLSLRESERLLEGLRELQLPLALLVNNKVTAENRPTADRVAETLKRKAGAAVPLATVALNGNFSLGGSVPLYAIAEDLTVYLDTGEENHV
jgi:arsenite/tail-anchored protein-transporting ATPase